MVSLSITNEQPLSIDDLPTQERRSVVEDDHVHFVTMHDGDQLRAQPDAYIEALSWGWVAISLEEDSDIHVALPMGSPLGMAAEEVGGSDPEVRMVLKVLLQSGELLCVHGRSVYLRGLKTSAEDGCPLDSLGTQRYVPGMTLKTPPQARVSLPLDAISAFCLKWRVEELSLFGSVLREDFSPNSDVDVLVTFSPEAKVSLFEFVEMQEELEVILQRKVDLVSKGGLRNPFRRHEILNTRQIVYAA